MASETIRDVVIRVSLKLADDKALKAGTAQIRQAATEQMRQANATKSTNAQAKIGADIEKQKLLLAREQIGLSRQREARLKAEVELERQKLQLQRQQMSMAGRAGGVAGGGLDRRSTKMRDPSIMIGGTELKVAKIFAASMIISQIPEALKSIATGEIWEKMAVVGLGLIEGFEGVVLGLSSLIDDLVGKENVDAARNPLTLMLARMMGADDESTIEEMRARKGERLKPGFLAGKMRENLENMGIDTGEDIAERKLRNLAAKLQRQADLEQQKNDLILKMLPAESELLKITKEKIQSAKEEFGMMTAREQEAMAATAERFKKVGAGGLGQNEMDFLRSNKAIAALFAQKAAAQASTGAAGKMFEGIVTASGTSEVLAKEQAAHDARTREAMVKIQSLDLIKNFNVNVDPKKLAEDLAREAAPAIEAALQANAAHLKAILERMARGQNANRGAAGGGARL